MSITSTKSSKLADIEIILQGLVPSKNLQIPFFKNNEKVFSEAYLIPIGIESNRIYGFFGNDGKLTETPIGFSRNKFGFETRYSISANTEIKKNHFKDSLKNDPTIYLPLKLLNMTYFEDSRENKIFGMENESNGKLPILLVMETEKGTQCYGIYNSNGDIKKVNYDADYNNSIKIRETLAKTRLGKAYYILNSKSKQKKESKIEVMTGNLDWEDPQEIIKHLDKYVIGQKSAKETLAGVFSNYLIKVQTDDPQIRKTNVMMLGPTGVGKTLLVETLANAGGLPFEKFKLTGVTPEGYIGRSLSDGYKRFRKKVPDIEAPYGIFFFDEIDKKSMKRERAFGEEIQDEIFGVSGKDGQIIDFPETPQQTEESEPLDTRNILFIVAGAFSKNLGGKSLENLVKEKNGQTNSIGFTRQIEDIKQEQNLIQKVTLEDIQKYGFKPEFLGRFPIITSLTYLTTEQKTEILTDAEDSVWTSYQKIFKARNLNIQIDETIPRIIAENCPIETGARALDTTCSQLFTPILIDTKKFIDNKGIIKITSELANEILHLKK